MLAAADLPQAKDYNPKEDMRTSGEGVQLGLKGERSLHLGSGGWEKQKTRLGW